jgi:hypothetical protein
MARIQGHARFDASIPLSAGLFIHLGKFLSLTIALKEK